MKTASNEKKKTEVQELIDEIVEDKTNEEKEDVVSYKNQIIKFLSFLYDSDDISEHSPCKQYKVLRICNTKVECYRFWRDFEMCPKDLGLCSEDWFIKIWNKHYPKLKCIDDKIVNCDMCSVP